MCLGFDVSHEHVFDKELAALSGNPRLGDEFVGAATWVLSRNPMTGMQVDGVSGVWVLPCADRRTGRAMIFYTIDEPRRKVYLLSIRRFTETKPKP